MQAFKVAVALKPDFAEAHYHLGCTYDAAGQPGPAVQEFRQAARLKPGYVAPCFALSHFFEFSEQGKNVPEDEEVTEVLRDWANCAFNNHLLEFSELGNKLPEVEEIMKALRDSFLGRNVETNFYERLPLGPLEEDTRTTPEDAVAWYRLGRAYAARQRKAKGLWALRKAVSLDPCLADAWCALSQDCPVGSASNLAYLRWPYEA
jgi:tetratricopeptide (TPR) repeat protein